VRFQWTRERVVTKNGRRVLEPRKQLYIAVLSYQIVTSTVHLDTDSTRKTHYLFPGPYPNTTGINLHQTSRHAWVVQWRSSEKETRFFLYRSVKNDWRDASVFLTSSISSLRISTSTAVFLLSKRLGALLSGLYPSVSPSLSCHQTSKVHLLHSVGRSANYSLESDNDD